ncbi:MAG TPA: PilZ domain-containing protein [Enterovirga sp.]|nr:PilZ domain-containing protein [Enterovirga sp.]
MEERRKTVRQRSYLGGRIAFNNRSSTMDCTVRNMSAGGARVAFSDTVVLPQDVDLAIRQKGLNARARVVWRSATEMGVSFLAVSREAAGEVIPLDLARRMRDLEAEKAALKQRVAALSTGDYVP